MYVAGSFPYVGLITSAKFQVEKLIAVVLTYIDRRLQLTIAAPVRKCICVAGRCSVFKQQRQQQCFVFVRTTFSAL